MNLPKIFMMAGLALLFGLPVYGQIPQGATLPQQPVLQPLPGLASFDRFPPLAPYPTQPVMPSMPAPVTVPTAVTSPSSPAASGVAANLLEGTWEKGNGLYFRSKDKEHALHIGGTVHMDSAFYSGGTGLQRFPGGTGRFSDGVNVRRGRMYMEGTLSKDFDFKFEMEFFNGFSPAGLTGPASAGTVSNSPGPTDLWLQMKNVPLLGNIRIGNQKEPFSLEHLNSYRNLEFLERSYLFDASQNTAFNNGFSPGVSVFRTWADDRIYSAIGFFKNESDLLGFGLGDGQYAVTGRLAALPLYSTEEQYFLHLGGSFSHRDPVGGSVQVRVRDNIRNAPFPLLNLIANTGSVGASSQTLFNVESAAGYGSVSFQAEYLANLVNGATVGAGPNVGTVLLQGLYAETMVLLTGEHRSFNNKTFTMNKVIPKHNFHFENGMIAGMGAWEVAARYSHMNLNDKTVNGGRLNSATLGLNWYLNPNAKLQFNYDYLYRDAAVNPLAQGSIHAFGMRMAYDF